MEVNKQMKHAKYLPLVLALGLIFPAAMWARDRNEHHDVQIGDPVQVGNTQLKPGSYTVEWQGDGPAVQAEFLQYGKLVATVPATLKSNDTEVVQDDVVIRDNGAQGKVLEELDFHRDKEALVLKQG